MSLIRFEEISLEFGDQVILREAGLVIEAGERVCLVGRNGAGKSTTFKLIEGSLLPDHGEVVCQKGMVVSQLAQTLPTELDRSVREIVSDGLGDLRLLREQYDELLKHEPDEATLATMQELQLLLDAHEGWQLEQRVESVISDLKLDPEKTLGELSGGWRRRVALARALVCKPELLLLDEPTNHLDLASIQWLESRIRNWPGAVLFITHDRAFAQNLSTRILELDRGTLVSYDCGYRKFLERREQRWKEEEEANARFDRRLAEEETWIRQGIKARRTRNEGRVRALKAMREEHAGRIKREHGPRIHIEQGEQASRRMIRARNVSYSIDDKPIIRDLNLNVLRGDRIGLIGNNGVGKSTLLRLLLGELQPDSGTIKRGANLQVGYFDQFRQKLDLDKSVADNVSDGRDYILLNGKQRHIVGYLKGFLFSPKRAMTPVRALSGGERNRLILARLFTRPSNLLVLDEPTNDLDVETLEVLEEKLSDYQGTLIVVSHDRAFLDQVVTSTLVFENDGQVHQHAGGFSDWLQRGRQLRETDSPADSAEQQNESPQTRSTSKARKLGYREQQELAALPQRIEQLETEIASLEATLADPAFYDRPFEEIKASTDALAGHQQALEQAMERWLELDG